MNKELSFSQRLHNALGSQEVENVKAQHSYLHAVNHSAEEWETIWSKSDNSTWAHFFGRMVGYDEVWKGSVSEHDAGIIRKFIELGKKFPEVYGKGLDIRGVTYGGGVHVLASGIVEVAEDGMSARTFYMTPGGSGDALNISGKRQTGILWERYGSDFVFANGDWLYLHEHVCPDIMSMGAFDQNNWAHDAYERELRSNPEELMEHPGPPCTDPGPLHFDYTTVQTVQNTVPWPVPYKTLDDDNSYAPGRNP